MGVNFSIFMFQNRVMFMFEVNLNVKSTEALTTAVCFSDNVISTIGSELRGEILSFNIK